MATGISFRDSYRYPKIGMFDARLSLLILPTMLHFRYWTVGVVLVAAVILYYFEQRRDMSTPSAVRMMRAWLAGPIRPAKALRYRRGLIDYGRILTGETRDNS